MCSHGHVWSATYRCDTVKSTMATLQDYRNERLRKLEELKALGFNPYPAESHRTHKAGVVVAQFHELEGQTVTVAGRIVGLRKFGKLAFIVLKDFSGQIQLFLHDGDVASLSAKDGIVGMKELSLLDTGDFVEATGEVRRRPHRKLRHRHPCTRSPHQGQDRRQQGRHHQCLRDR